MALEGGAVGDDGGLGRREADALAVFYVVNKEVRGAGEALRYLAASGCASGDVEVVDVDFDLAVELARQGGDDLVDGVQEADLGPGRGAGAPCDDAGARENAATAGCVEREEAREALSANGGAEEGNGHAEPRGVRDEARVLEAFVELLEGRLGGAEAESFGRCALCADGGAPNLV